MTDAKKPSPQPAAPLAGPARTASTAAAKAPGTEQRTVSSASMRAMSATRAQPLAAPKEDVKVQDRLKSGASNAFLNAIGAAKDAVEDFQSANRFFKYKAFIVAGWVALSIVSVLIARPGGDGAPDNDLDAKLVVSQTPSGTIYMVKNEGEEAWKNVVIEVNGVFKTTSRSELQSNDGMTLTPKILIGPGGKMAPSSLQIRDITVRTEAGTTTLLENGEKP